MLQICGKAFQSILGVSKYRIQNINKHFFNTGATLRENSGGDRKSKQYSHKTQRVVDFILQLNCIESHYVRAKSQRQYMASDCSIRKLWVLYCQENDDLKVKYGIFRKIFVEKFNISFKSSSTDACSECIRLKGLLASVISVENKAEIIIRLTVHKLKAKASYNMLRKQKSIPLN